MRRSDREHARAAELRAILAAYRQLTIEEIERGDWGDIQMEVEVELWRLDRQVARLAQRERRPI